ncbi:MAG: toll/interleukin-1 receptor domain-containing protein [Desulfobacterales bacterium]|nr:toll/interleukin-1 receptor domain-containing protein [Desulfobacterales bacterium]
MVDDESQRNLSLTVFLQQYKTDVFMAGDANLFVDELYRRWTERRSGTVQPPAVAPPAGVPMPTEAVFLSYTRADQGAVLTMKGALEQAGLDVWFDQAREDLLPGADWGAGDTLQHQTVRRLHPDPVAPRRGKSEGYFRREWKWAIERDEGMDPSRRFIQPVVVDDLPNGAAGIPDEFWQKQCCCFPNGQPHSDFVTQIRKIVMNLREKQVGYE